MSDAYLMRADFTEAVLIEANLTEADIIEANLIKATLTNAKMIMVDLSGSGLIRAEMPGVNLQDANLTRTSLPWANLTNANLTRVEVISYGLKGSSAHRDRYARGHSSRYISHWNQFIKSQLTRCHKQISIDLLVMAKTLYQAKLDHSLQDQLHKQYPHLLLGQESTRFPHPPVGVISI